MFRNKEQADVYFEHLARELEAVAAVVPRLHKDDPRLAGRLKDLAYKIRADSGLYES